MGNAARVCACRFLQRIITHRHTTDTRRSEKKTVVYDPVYAMCDTLCCVYMCIVLCVLATHLVVEKRDWPANHEWRESRRHHIPRRLHTIMHGIDRARRFLHHLEHRMRNISYIRRDVRRRQAAARVGHARLLRRASGGERAQRRRAPFFSPLTLEPSSGDEEMQNRRNES